MHHTKRKTNHVFYSSGGRVLVSIPVRDSYGAAKHTTGPAVLRNTVDVLPDPRDNHVSRSTAFLRRTSSGRYSRGDWESSFVTSTDLTADACTEWARWQHILQGTKALSTKDRREQHQQEPARHCFHISMGYPPGKDRRNDASFRSRVSAALRIASMCTMFFTARDRQSLPPN